MPHRISSPPDVVSRLEREQWSLAELVIVAVALAIAVGLVTNFLSARLTAEAALALAGALFLGATTFLWWRRFGARRHSYRIDGFIVLDRVSHELVPVPEYSLAEHLAMYQEMAFVENPALKARWDSTSIGQRHGQSTAAGSLVVEMLEYFLLDELSTHLMDYFGGPSHDDVLLREYQRQDLPDILLSNRFLELFSRPMEDRPAFVGKDHGENVYAAFEDSGYYNRFDLVLPKQSTVRRIGPGEIQIETHGLVFHCAVKFDGYGSVVPWSFVKNYLDYEPFDVINWKATYEIEVYVRPFRLMSSKARLYSIWVESFIAEFEAKAGRDQFFSRIAWPTIEAMLYCSELRKPSGAKSSDEGEVVE